MRRTFEWDPAKAASNLRKHGVAFDTAIMVFADPFALVEQERVVDGEERWQAIGLAGGMTILVVAHTYRTDSMSEERVRIISARRAERWERKRYEDEVRSI